jgi:hypothetical protein
VADGFCRDGNGISYDAIEFSNIGSPQDCGKRCLACPGKGQSDLEFRGFSFEIFDDGGELVEICICHVDDGADEETLEGACTGYSDVFLGNGGSGEIKQVFGFPGVVCYKRKGGKSKSSKRGKANNNKAGGM